MTENNERAQVGWRFWLGWVLASAVGFAVDEALVGAVTGVLVGIAQWLVLRRRISRAGWWVLASIVGFAVTFAVLEAVGFAVTFAVSGAVAGALVGIAQWLVLRRRASRAGWWVLASIVGFAAGLAVIFAVFEAIRMAEGFTVSHTAALAVAGVVGGAVYGAITGGVMVWLLRQLFTGEPILQQDATEAGGGGKVMTDNTERTNVGWRFWGLWVLASTSGLLMGLAMGGEVGGAVVGIAQWLVLRRQISRAGWWVLASIMGLAVGFALLGLATVSEPVSGVVAGVVVGASVGIAQWLVLRRQVSLAGWWVLASSVGFAVPFAVVTHGAGAGATIGALLGPGAITGGVMVWMLRQPRREMNIEPTHLRRDFRIERGFWTYWFIVSIVGLAAGLPVAFVVGVIVPLFVGSHGGTPETIEGWAWVGAAVGGAQWLVLRWKVVWASSWVVASAVSFAVVFAVIFAVGSDMILLLLLLLSLASIGAVPIWLLRQPVSEEPSLPPDAA